MPAQSFEVSDVSCRRSNMPLSPVHEMHRIVHEAAEPAVPGERVAAAIGRAARVLGISFVRARAHWYGLARQITAQEADFLRARRIELREQRITQLEHELAALRALREERDARMAVERDRVRAERGGDGGGLGWRSYHQRRREAAPGGQGLLALG